MATVYPFDPTGTSAANRISNEQQVITAQNFRDYHYVIPKFAPFFEKNISVRMQYPNGTTRTLTRGVDYYFANQFIDASRACASPIFGAISFLDTDTAGILSITYNTVGGMWNLTASEIIRILAEEMRNPRTTTWEQITNLPQRFPVIDHQWDLVDMVGVTPLIGAVLGVRDAITQTNGSTVPAHIADKGNPHQVTKAQVGLGSVANYPVATIQQAQEGTFAAAFMTPERTRQAISVLGAALINAHAADVNNPHNTTKTQIGLDRVQNYPIATEAQARAGTTDTAYMSPLRTSQAIATLVGTAFTAHAASKLNPHDVTKDQVGLFNLENYPVATEQEARAGVANDRYMTPRRTTQLTQELITVQLDGHATRLDNPHETTAIQVGAYSIQQVDTKLAGYIKLTDEWVAGKSKEAFIAETLEGTANNALTIDGRTITQVIGEGVSFYDNLYSQTKELLSRDRSATANPGTNPYRWIKLGIVNLLSNTATNSPNSIPTTNPDVYWFYSGGRAQVADAAANAALSSPGYLIHAKSTNSGTSYALDVTRLSGYAGTSYTNNDIRFGSTFNPITKELTIWVRVAYGYNDINVTNLSSIGGEMAISDDNIITEPASIAYVNVVNYATIGLHDALALRTTNIETLNATQTGRLDAIDISLQSMLDRLTALETAPANPG